MPIKVVRKSTGELGYGDQYPCSSEREAVRWYVQFPKDDIPIIFTSMRREGPHLRSGRHKLRFPNSAFRCGTKFRSGRSSMRDTIALGSELNL